VREGFYTGGGFRNKENFSSFIKRCIEKLIDYFFASPPQYSAYQIVNDFQIKHQIKAFNKILFQKEVFFRSFFRKNFFVDENFKKSYNFAA
jgi:hypothetical protein